jgi:hypothetical protein
MTLIEAAQKALEALENVRSYDKGNLYGLDENITALNAAIEAAEKQEPVAWAMDYDIESVLSGFSTRLMGTAMRIESAFPKHRVKLLYTTPPAQPAPAPSSWTEIVAVNLVREGINKHKARELAAHFHELAQPPQRKPLTIAELRKCFLATNTTEPLAEGWPGLERFARAIEAAHGIKEKNNGN